MEDTATVNGVGPGTEIAETYRIVRPLGEGGMGLVFEAQHLRLSKRVAIKVLRTAPDAQLLARFRQEAEIASRIGHPNIIDVLDFNTLPSGTAYLVMELLEGESLAVRARRGPMTHTEALPILRQIASALYAAHGAGVIHRDLKPENVFLVPRELAGAVTDHVKILDFGISKVHGSAVVRTSEDVVLGTPRYMAPEQALGLNDEIDARVDQFALGVIAFELLTGRLPFAGDSGTQVMYEIVYGEAARLGPLAPSAPADVVAAIERALAKRPQDRFEDMSELAHALTGKPLPNAPERTRPSIADDVPTQASPRAPRPTDPPSSTEAPTVGPPRPPRATAPPPIADPATVAASPHARSSPAPSSPAPSSSRILISLVVLGAIAVAATIAFLVRGLGTVPISADAAPHLGTLPSSERPEMGTVPISADGLPGMGSDPISAQPQPGTVPELGTVPRPPVVSGSPITNKRPPPAKPALSPEASALLDEAEQALAARQLGKAKVVAERALRAAPKELRAYLVLVEAACRRSDLGEAHTWMRKMPRSSWGTARTRCDAAGFPIENPR